MTIRNISKIFFLILFFSVFYGKALALDTRAGAINERIKSMQITLNGDPYAPAVINLGTDDQLYISFDHLAEDREYLRYELVHCNANWQPSGLVDSEILDGFNYGDINDYDFSQMTTTHYVHYGMTIPNEDVNPKISGNYLLKIYPENNPDDVWAQYRFMVSENSALIDATVTGVTDIDYNREHQQLSVAVDCERSSVVDPYNDVMLYIQQNGRYDNEVSLRQPMRLAGRNKLVYEHQKPLIFEAGNEYRRFETVSTTYPGMHVEDITYSEPYYHFDLTTDIPRDDVMYLYDQTQHGRYFIREYDSSQSDIESDYVVVHFTLDMPQMKDALIFIDGDLTDRRFDPEALMTYNPSTERYERNMLLKQGAYNYQYLTVPKGANRGYTNAIEGDKFQTTNEYLIKVYTSHPGDRYDRLIGVSKAFSY